jgi:hypothetical protein
MTYLGHFENGILVLENGATIPEGARVRVELLPSAEGNGNSGDESGSTMYDHYKSIIGVIKDMPPDFATQHDHYIHGTPKK